MAASTVDAVRVAPFASVQSLIDHSSASALLLMPDNIENAVALRGRPKPEAGNQQPNPPNPKYCPPYLAFLSAKIKQQDQIRARQRKGARQALQN